MLHSLHTVRVPHRKNTAEKEAVRLPAPETVILPLSMHIGAPASPIVKPGDKVSIGQPVAEPGGVISAFVHAPISGTVKKLETITLSAGQRMPAIVIAGDGENRVYEGICPPTIEDYPSFTEAIRRSGAVGLGGAGFPTVIKLMPKDRKKVETLLINGAECEPYITSDTRTMLDHGQDILEGIRLLHRFFTPKRTVIAIEDNKTACIQNMKAILGNECEVCTLPSRYPQGGEKVLIYHVTGRMVPEGKLPLDVGALVLNCTTLAFLASYVRTGMPLIEKCVTVDGDCVKTPMNITVPIGTPVKDVFAFAGGFTKPPKKLLYGGPMMGTAIPDDRMPVLKNTNALLALSEQATYTPTDSPCIRCGSCLRACPLGLTPPLIEAAFDRGDTAKLDRLRVNLCMECGCCAYVCPAHRPIVQTHRLAKQRLIAEKKKKEAMKK